MSVAALGSPHVNGLAWLPGAPKVEWLLSSNDNIVEEITLYVDTLVSTMNLAIAADGMQTAVLLHAVPKTNPLCNKSHADIKDFPDGPH